MKDFKVKKTGTTPRQWLYLDHLNYMKLLLTSHHTPPVRSAADGASVFLQRKKKSINRKRKRLHHIHSDDWVAGKQ